MQELIPPDYDAVDPAGASRSGGAKLRESNALPNCFLFYQAHSKTIIGAAVAVECCAIRGDASAVWWRFTRPVRLQSPVKCTAEFTRYYGRVFTLKPAGEAKLRLAPTTVGGVLGSHFPEFEHRRFRCFQASPSQCENILGGLSPSTVIQTEPEHRRAAGVVATNVDAPPKTDPVSEFQADGHDDPSANAPGPDTGNPSSSTTACDAERQLQSAFTQGGGACLHRYVPSSMLAFMDLAEKLKPSATMNDTLSTCAMLFFGDGGTTLASKLSAGAIPLPTASTLKMARLKLDMLSMIFQQKLFLRFDFLIYQLIDSSPQLGFNFLITVEDQIRIPWPATWDLARRAALDLNEHFVTLLQAFASLGLGKANTLVKTVTTTNTLISGVESVADFDRRRKSHRGFCTDHGVEHGIGAMPLGVTHMGVPDADDPLAFLYPNSVSVVDLLHTLWGGYERVCKENDLFDAFQDILHPLIAFTSDSQVMRKFRATCLNNADLPMFKSKAVIHIDWRWESMTKALDSQVPIHNLFRARFDEKVLLETDSKTKVMQCSIIKNVAKAFTEMSALEFLATAEFYRVVGKVVENYAGKAEICDCHAELWQPGRPFKKRRKLMEEAIGRKDCVWVGRRLPWFIAEGFNNLIDAIVDASSPTLQDLLGAMDAVLRGKIVLAFERMRASLVQHYQGKFDYMFHGIFLAIGAYYCNHGGCPNRSKELLRRLFAEVDRAVRQGNSDKLDNVTRTHFLPGSMVRKAAESFCSSEDGDMKQFPCLFVKLQEYALIPAVARRVEKAHALIKKAGAHKFGISLPYLCALIRERSNLDAIKAQPDFREFCCENWHSRNITHRLLHLRVSADELKHLTFDNKVKLVYQCSVEHEYKPVPAEDQRVAAEFSAIVPCLKPITYSIPESVQQCIKHIKSLFVQGEYYSMPRWMLEMCTASTFTSTDGASGRCVQRLVDSTLLPDIPVVHTDDMVTFRLTTAFPENRKTMTVAHLELHRTLVECMVLDVERQNPNGSVVIARTLASMQRAMVVFDCVGLVENIEKFTRETIRWSQRGVRAIPVIAPPEKLMLGDLGMPALVAPDLDDPMGSHGVTPSSAALVPVAPTQDMQVAVNQLVIGGHISGTATTRLSTTGMSSGLATQLVSLGVLHATQQEDQEMQLAVRPRALQWACASMLTTPIPFCRLSRHLKDVFKYSKVELMIALRHDGFSDGKPTGPLVHGAELVCKLNINQAVSYLIAMLRHKDIFEKGVGDISHTGLDNYYRCLVKLSAHDLSQVLPLMDGKTDEWFKKEIAKRSCIRDNSSSSEEEPPPVVVPGPLMLPDVPCVPLPAPDVDPLYEPWCRQEVSLGPDSEVVRVYVANPDRRSGHQQAWLTCVCHPDDGCIRWRRLTGTQRQFFGYMYAWHKDARDHPDRLNGRGPHMAHEPSPELIAACGAQLVLADF